MAPPVTRLSSRDTTSAGTRYGDTAGTFVSTLVLGARAREVFMSLKRGDGQAAVKYNR